MLSVLSLLCISVSLSLSRVVSLSACLSLRSLVAPTPVPPAVAPRASLERLDDMHTPVFPSLRNISEPLAQSSMLWLHASSGFFKVVHTKHL